MTSNGTGPLRSFASDNSAGIHPEVIGAIARANRGHVLAYGHDPITEGAAARVAAHFGSGAEVFFVFTGSAANVLAVSALLRPYEAVVCADCAHLNVDECGAPERFAGCKLLPLQATDGKISPESLATVLGGIGVEHHVQPRLVSITEATEYGTVYSPAEINAIADAAHAHDMYLHVDGARLANAAAALDLELAELTSACGVDVVSLGGTKNGLMIGEAVVFLRADLARDFKFLRKQAMQLGSKLRFIAAQFGALYGGDLWLRNARNANAMAKLLAERASALGVEITAPVEANAVFARMPRKARDDLAREWPFYVWDDAADEVRWMTAWDTTSDDVEGFAESLRAAVSA